MLATLTQGGGYIRFSILDPAPQGMGAPLGGRYGNDTEMEFVRAVPVSGTGFPVPWPGTIPGIPF